MKWSVLCSLAVATTLTTAAGALRERRQARPCLGGEDCVKLHRCASFQGLIRNGHKNAREIITKALCDGNLNDLTSLKVCCPETGSPITPGPAVNGEDLLPKVGECGQSGGGKVVHGEDAPLNAYPWMVLLGYRDRNNPTWNCGGALINNRYVLTAAHCVDAEFIRQAGTGNMVAVRLGEHNTATNPDCPEISLVDRDCADPPQDFFPEDIIIHTTFNDRGPVSDDIALIRLDRNVTMSDSIHPVCLPVAGLDVETFVGARDAFVAGWGATERLTSSEVLQVAKIPFANKIVCESFYSGQLVNEQVCFGGRGVVDSCFGDSGGPVFQTTTGIPHFTVLGIVSRGLPQCGVDGAPAVYTNVAFYRKWITDNLKP